MRSGAASRPTTLRMLHGLRLAASCLVATLTLAGVAGCGGSDAAQSVAGEPVSLEELSRSARTSAEARSGRFSFSMTMSLPGAEEQFAFTGEGAFDAASDRASFSMDMSSFARLLGGFVAGARRAHCQGRPGLRRPERLADRRRPGRDGELRPLPGGRRSAARWGSPGFGPMRKANVQGFDLDSVRDERSAHAARRPEGGVSGDRDARKRRAPWRRDDALPRHDRSARVREGAG